MRPGRLDILLTRINSGMGGTSLDVYLSEHGDSTGAPLYDVDVYENREHVASFHELDQWSFDRLWVALIRDRSGRLGYREHHFEGLVEHVASRMPVPPRKVWCPLCGEYLY